MLTVRARTEGDQFTEVTGDDIPRLLAIPEALLWVDLEHPAPAEVAILSDVFHFHHLTIDDCLNHRVDPPKVDDYGDYLFIIAQGVDFSARGGTVTTTELNAYIGPNYVVTFHQRPMPAITETHDRCVRGATLPVRGADWLAHGLLDTLVDHLLPVVEEMDEEIASLEDEALSHPEPEMVERLMAMKRSTLRLRRLIAPQRDVVNRLSRGDFSHLIRDETRMYFRDIYDHLVRMEDMIEGLRELSDSVVSTYLSTMNNRMNEIMKSLSLVSVVFLPLTLLASVFGTNFAPTYEAWGWPGFLGMCAVIFACALVLIWWFRRRHWL